MATRVTLSLRHESPTVYTLDFQSQTLLRFEESGKRGKLTDLEEVPFSAKDILRWGAPFALEPQGVVSLHASAVRRNQLAISFLGVGGSGKSTLARLLAERHWQRLADDMMMIDDMGRVNSRCEEVLHRWCDAQSGKSEIDYRELAEEVQKPDLQNWVSLRALLFLDRYRGEEFRLRPLEPGKCFHRLVKYGFGGLPTPAAWEHQFRIYGALAAKLKAGILQTPDGLDILTAKLPQLENCLNRWLSDSDAN